MKSLLLGLVILFLFNSHASAITKELAEQLQAQTVLVKTDSSQGSGVLITRQVGDNKIHFILTAAHVIEDVKRVRTIIDPKSGQKREVVEFPDVKIVKQLIESGRKVGDFSLDCQVIRFSDSEHGQDLAVLLVRKKNFVDTNTEFADASIELWNGKGIIHVGNLLGEFGSNSISEGLISNVGRVIKSEEFGQSSATSMAGSSGGGIFESETGKYIGMLTMGARDTETFGLFIPIYRITKWLDRNELGFIFDSSKTIDLEKLSQQPVEDVGQIIEK